MSGTWSRGSGTPGFYGGNYRSHPAGDGAAVVRWRPEVPASREYEVSVRYAAHEDRGSDVPYTVRHEDGTTTVRVDQRRDGGTWVPIGRFPFVAGNRGAIELGDDAGGVVIADAVRLTPATPGE